MKKYKVDITIMLSFIPGNEVANHDLNQEFLSAYPGFDRIWRAFFVWWYFKHSHIGGTSVAMSN